MKIVRADTDTVLLGLILMLSLSCDSSVESYTERRSWEGGEIVEYYEYLDDSKTSLVPIIVKQEFISWDQSFEYTKVVIVTAFVDHSRVYLIVDNRYGRFLTSLCKDGELEYICEINEIRYDIICDFHVVALEKNRIKYVFEIQDADGTRLFEKISQYFEMRKIQPYLY